MPALIPALLCTVKEGPVEASFQFILHSKILQSWAKAYSLGLAPKPTWPEWGLGISLPSFQQWTVPALRTSYRAMGPDPGCGQLSQKGQPQGTQGGMFCHLCSRAAQGPWGRPNSAGTEAQLR